MELRYDVPAREPDEGLVADWAEEISETSGFESFISLAEDLYIEAEDEGLDSDVFGYNLGLAVGKAEEHFSLEDEAVNALRYGLGSSVGRRGEDRIKAADLFDYGVDDFEEIAEEYGF